MPCTIGAMLVCRWSSGLMTAGPSALVASNGLASVGLGRQFTRTVFRRRRIPRWSWTGKIRVCSALSFSTSIEPARNPPLSSPLSLPSRFCLIMEGHIEESVEQRETFKLSSEILSSCLIGRVEWLVLLKIGYKKRLGRHDLTASSN